MSEKAVHVIDDDAAIRDSLRILLRLHGIDVKTYPSAMAFLTSAPVDECGCLLLDNHMPDMSGLELLELLRTRNVSIPVILMSGGADPLLGKRAERAGALAVLNKPVPSKDLLDWIGLAISGASPATRVH